MEYYQEQEQEQEQAPDTFLGKIKKRVNFDKIARSFSMEDKRSRNYQPDPDTGYNAFIQGWTKGNKTPYTSSPGVYGYAANPERKSDEHSARYERALETGPLTTFANIITDPRQAKKWIRYAASMGYKEHWDPDSNAVYYCDVAKKCLSVAIAGAVVAKLTGFLGGKTKKQRTKTRTRTRTRTKQRRTKQRRTIKQKTKKQRK